MSNRAVVHVHPHAPASAPNARAHAMHMRTSTSLTVTVRAGRRGRCLTTNNATEKPEPVEADKDPDAYTLAILPADEIRLPEVLRHIEAGRIVLVISATQRPR